MARVGVSVLDTGPCLNFFSTGQAALLLDVLEAISATLVIPEDVENEIRTKAQTSPVFRPAAGALDWSIRNERLSVLSARTGEDLELDRNVSAILGMEHEQSARRAKDQGERMVVAHAKTLQQRGESVIVLIDEWRGQKLAAQHGLVYTDTLHVLRKAAIIGKVATWGEMRAIYGKMQPNDLSLPRVDSEKVRLILRDPKIYLATAAAAGT